MLLPLLFQFRHAFTARAGFKVGVMMQGRALLEVDSDGEVWLEGVAPAGFAAGDTERDAALRAFESTWCNVLEDIAVHAESFDAFKAECERFLETRVERITADWDAALAAVRAKKVDDGKLRSLPADEYPVRYVIANLEGWDVQPDKQHQNQVSAAA